MEFIYCLKSFRLNRGSGPLIRGQRKVTRWKQEAGDAVGIVYR